MQRTLIWKYIYQVTLLVGILIIWTHTIWAHTSEYDSNYGEIIFAFIVSLILLVLMVILWFVKRSIIVESRFVSLLFIVTSSPVSIAVFIAIDEWLVGQYFKVG
jgi:hypothetical protein